MPSPRTPMLRGLNLVSRQALARSSAKAKPALPSYICAQCRLQSSSTDDAKRNPTLSRLREDLKTAMRAKDAARLSVLRAVLANITNASKTNAPVKDDLALLALL